MNPNRNRVLVAEHDDLEFLELIRAEAQRRELQKAPEHEVAERPEQRAAPVVGRTGRRTLRTRTATPTRPELMHPTGFVSLGVVASAVVVALGVQIADPIIGLVITGQRTRDVPALHNGLQKLTLTGWLR
jgi:hypothetical protein